MRHETDTATRVVVADINMPFWSIVRLMIKWAFAAIPAIIILSVVGAVLSALLGGLIMHAQDRKTVSTDVLSPPPKLQLV